MERIPYLFALCASVAVSALCIGFVLGVASTVAVNLVMTGLL